MEIKSPWLCVKCGGAVQCYFGERLRLPCFRCHPPEVAVETFDPTWYGVETDWRWSLAFRRNYAADMWQPEACINPDTILSLVDVVKAEGLGGCFLSPRHLHGHFVLKEGETLAEKCPDGGCTYERAAGPESFFGIDRSTRSKLLASYVGDGQPLTPEAIEKACESLRFTPIAPPFYDARWLMRPLDDSTWDFAPDPKTQSTPSDVRGRCSMIGETSPGCRLGCACDQHRPPREPWVPSIDETDLLPDA